MPVLMVDDNPPGSGESAVVVKTHVDHVALFVGKEVGISPPRNPHVCEGDTLGERAEATSRLSPLAFGIFRCHHCSPLLYRLK